MRQKNLCGIGVCDINNVRGTKLYNIWNGMVRRCYSKKEQKTRYKDYIGCSVDINWIYISNFKKWYDEYYIEDYQIDKDLLIPNNKVYSPATCLFVPNYINGMITKHKTGKYLQGVRPNGKKWVARITIFGILKHIGTYETELLAHQAYIQAKTNYFVDIADTFWQTDEKIATGLYRHAETLLGYDWKETLPE